MTSLKQLSVAEFSGEETRPMVYENGHKNLCGFGSIWYRMSKFGWVIRKSKDIKNQNMSIIIT